MCPPSPRCVLWNCKCSTRADFGVHCLLWNGAVYFVLNAAGLLQELTRHHDRAECQVLSLRDKLKDIKTEADTKDKQLDIASRSVDRLTSEKLRLEVS